MCPSSGHGGGLWGRLRRAARVWQSRDILPLTFLVLAALLLVAVLYWFPVLSLLVVCGAGAYHYHTSRRPLWRLPAWRALTGGAAGRRQREPTVKWTSPASSLLMMGSYLGTQEPPQGLGRGTRELKDLLSRPNPAVPTPARRLSFRDTPVMAEQAFLSPRRRYPIKQPQFSRPGSLPTGCFDGHQKKHLVSKRSRATVKFPRLDTSFARSPILENLLPPGPTSPPVQCAPDPCAKETVLSAIRECMKRKQIGKEEYSTSGGLENKRRRLESSGSAESSEYLLPNGTLPSYVSERQASSGSAESSSEYLLTNVTLPSYASESGSLKRVLHSQALEDHINKRPCISSVSSRSSSATNGMKNPTHNAITSSYSSSIIPYTRKRNHHMSAASSSPTSRHQTDVFAKRSRELCEAGQSTPVQSETDQTGRLNESSPNTSTTNSPTEKGRPFPRREKLLRLIAGREPYKLPPPPIPGYSVTQKDFDADKKASLERLNKAMGVTAAPAQTINTSTAEEKTTVSAPLTSPPEPAKPSGSTTTASSLPAPVVTDGLKIAPSQSSITAQPKSESPKSSLLQILTKPLEVDSQTGFLPVLPTAPSTNPFGGVSVAAGSATNTFKPIFGENSKPVQSSVQSSSTSSTPSTFKPIFGDSAAQPPATSTFTFQMNAASSAATPLFPGFGAKSTSITFSADSATKPSLAPLTSSTSSTTNTLTSLFPSAVSTIGSTPAPVNSLPASKAQEDSPAKPFVFKQTTTSQATSGLNVFSSTQPAPVSAPQQSSLFAFNSAFTTPVSSNSGTSTSGSAKTQPTFVNFGTSSQPTFGTNSQPQFGVNSTFNANPGNSTFVSKEPFGNMNNTQTNSTPATNLFASKPVSVESSNSAPSFGTPAPSLNFGNSLAQNSSVSSSSTPMGFGTQGAAENELSFAPQFGQGSPVAPLSFSASTPSNTGSPFVNFRIGVTPKPGGARQRVLARRQHQRKK